MYAPVERRVPWEELFNFKAPFDEIDWVRPEMGGEVCSLSSEDRIYLESFFSGRRICSYEGLL